MSLPIQPGRGSSRSGYSPSARAKTFELVRSKGYYGMAVAVIAMALGLSPTFFLAYWNAIRANPLLDTALGRPVQVKDKRLSDEAEKDEPGDTALLYISCELTQQAGREELLQLSDQQLRRDSSSPTIAAYKERVYLRPTNKKACPFAFLGEPPVSVWLPAGEYEIAVVYPSGGGYGSLANRELPPFPLATEQVSVKLETGHKEVVKIPLYHHDHSFASNLSLTRQASHEDDQNNAPPDNRLHLTDVAGMLAAFQKTTCVPSPAGIVMEFPEPVIHHDESHGHCTSNLAELAAVRREWTAAQLQELRVWLPGEAAEARERLQSLENGIGWREFCSGWLWYLITGVTGLTFARWVTVAKLAPYRSRHELWQSLKLLIGIFSLAIGLGLVAAVILR